MSIVCAACMLMTVTPFAGSSVYATAGSVFGPNPAVVVSRAGSVNVIQTKSDRRPLDKPGVIDNIIDIFIDDRVARS